MIKNIYYFPAKSGSNIYPVRMKEILSKFSIVHDLYFSLLIKELVKLNFSRHDIVIVNWLESGIIKKNGKLSFAGVIKVFIKLVLLKLKFKKIIFVKHNKYPHNTNHKYIKVATRIVNLINLFSDSVIMHSPVGCDNKSYYIPHPLYTYPVKPTNNSTRSFFNDNYYIFGRIVKYKKYESIISTFPANKNLIIMGACEDYEYKKMIQELCKNKKNVTFIPEYISDERAKELLSTGAALIISHSDEDMIVSGSFFYGLTIGIKILAINTPFLNWASSVLQKDVIETFDDLESMMHHIKITQNEESSHYSFKSIEDVNKYFGDNSIKSKFMSLLDIH
ncbi:hypothetical protein [Klebsiella spallanzanii]|uniref:hypothetical protein n=1 Tax=Klebsiella spallanzanii TaxID=2587528 RepID=UPI0025943FA0|nr:hypothetical protein [Klebsiella spallanzanii]MDM4207497.1 hypothetical protein [Klebsiella spallanzanii]